MGTNKKYMEKLFPRKKNLVRNSFAANCVKDMNLYGPFNHHSFKRSSVISCNFFTTDLKYSAWTGSFFREVNFKNSKLIGANLQLCVFDECLFSENDKKNDKSFMNISFCNCLFKYTKFINITFKNCVLTDATFISCEFENCKFQSSSFDGTKFIKCNFDHLIARNMNLDYSQYRDCEFRNSQISLFQIAYTLGLLQCIPKDSDNVFAFQGKEIAPKVFFNEYIYYLCEYFKDLKDLYPLSNLFYFLENKDAKKLIIRGIKEAMVSQKYKLVLHYCELINYYFCLNSKEKHELISFLNSTIEAISLNENIREAVKYSILIQHYLLNKYDNIPHCYISIETEYNVKNGSEIKDLIAELDNLLIIEQGEKGEHSITITHNSPIWLDIVLAIGSSILGAYLKEEVIDRIINKLKEIFKNKKIKLKNITIKNSDKNEIKIINQKDNKSDQ